MNTSIASIMRLIEVSAPIAYSGERDRSFRRSWPICSSLSHWLWCC